MSEHSTRNGPGAAKLPPPTRAQRLAAAGFLGAFGLTILTVLLTGLSVGAPSTKHLLQPGTPVAAGAASPRAETEPAAPGDVPASPAPGPRSVAEPSTVDEPADEPAAPADGTRAGEDAARKTIETKKKADDPSVNAAR